MRNLLTNICSIVGIQLMVIYFYCYCFPFPLVPEYILCLQLLIFSSIEIPPTSQFLFLSMCSLRCLLQSPQLEANFLWSLILCHFFLYISSSTCHLVAFTVAWLPFPINLTILIRMTAPWGQEAKCSSLKMLLESMLNEYVYTLV